MRKYHEQYANLTSLFYPEADAQNVQQARSLAELEEELHQRETTRHVISVARSILQIQTRDGKPLPSLHEQHTLASETIANFGAHLTPEQIQVFVEGRHPWHDLVHMVQDGGSLPDAEWTELNTSIESSLGLALAVAAARGRLEITNSIETEAEPDSPDHHPQHSFTDSSPASNRQTGIDAPTQPASIDTPNSEKEPEPATLHFPVKPSHSTPPDTVSSSAMADDSRVAQSDAEVALARTSPRSSAFVRALTKSTNERPLKPQLTVVAPEVPTEDKLPTPAVNEAKVPTALNDLHVHRSESVEVPTSLPGRRLLSIRVRRH